MASEKSKVELGDNWGWLYYELEKETGSKDWQEEAEAWVRSGMPAPKVKGTKNESHILTYSGIKFYPFDPRPTDVSLVDVAHALSGEPRYGAHTIAPWSVAQHVMLAADMALADKKNSECVYEILHHDDSEAYIKDMPKPIKRFLAEYTQLEEAVTKATRKAFGILPIKTIFDKTVKEYDEKAFEIESKILRDPKALDIETNQNSSFGRLLRMTRNQVRGLFINYHNWLKSELK